MRPRVVDRPSNSSMKKELRDFLDGKILEVKRRPLHHWIIAEPFLIDNSNRLTENALAESMYYPLKPGLQKILKSALNTELVIRAPHSKIKPFKRLLGLLELIDGNRRLTPRGYFRAIGCLPLKKQCETLDISLETISLPKKNRTVETDVFEHYRSQGWEGLHDEGKTFSMILHAFRRLNKPVDLVLPHDNYRMKLEISKQLSRGESKIAAIKTLIEIRDRGLYNFSDAYLEWKSIYIEPMKDLATSFENRLQKSSKTFIDKVKKVTQVEDEFLLDEIIEVICDREERSGVKESSLFGNKELEEELAREEKSLEALLGYNPGAFAFSDKISPREAIFHLFCISY